MYSLRLEIKPIDPACQKTEATDLNQIEERKQKTVSQITFNQISKMNLNEEIRKIKQEKVRRKKTKRLEIGPRD